MLLERADETSLPRIIEMTAACIAHMRAAGIDQWDEIYPAAEDFRRDCAGGNLLMLRDAELNLAGCATLDDRQSAEYATVDWAHRVEPVGVVHRLMINPSHMGKGMSRLLMRHVEEEALRRGYRVLRLDAFIKNPAALRLYHGLGYRHAGDVRFRKGPFACFEKPLDGAG